MKMLENMTNEELREIIKIKDEEIKRLREEIEVFMKLVKSIKEGR